METITLMLSKQMVVTIANILGKQPYEIVAPIIQEMQRQIDHQQQLVPQRPHLQEVEK